MTTTSSYRIIITAAFIFITGCTKAPVFSVEDFPLSNSANNNGIGASAKEMLTAIKPKLLVEIQYMPGYQLQQQTITNLKNFLRTYLNKPGGIVVIQSEIPETGSEIYSLADIAKIEQQYRTAFNTNDQVSVNVLITNGVYTNGHVLGVSFRNTSICMFGKIIEQRSGGLPDSRLKIECTVLTHEFGHLFGLVDLGSPMQTDHRDAGHGNHCNNATCLMDYGIETNVISLLLSGTIPVFDANCRNDLRANGGK